MENVNNYDELKPTYTRIVMYNEKPDKDMMAALVKQIHPSIVIKDYSLPVAVFGELYMKGFAQLLPNDDGILTICEKLNALLYRIGSGIKLNAQNFMKNDNVYIKKRREQYEPTKTYDINNIDHYLYNIGYEIMEILIYMNDGKTLSEPYVIIVRRKN